MRAVRDMGLSKQALYCYSKAYSLDPTNVDALWDRAILAKEMGQINTVRAAPFTTCHPAYTMDHAGKNHARRNLEADPP